MAIQKLENPALGKSEIPFELVLVIECAYTSWARHNTQGGSEERVSRIVEIIAQYVDKVEALEDGLRETAMARRDSAKR